MTREPADEVTVWAYARTSPQEFVDCRLMNHAFPPVPRQNIDFDLTTDDGFMVRFEVCPRCGCAVQAQIFEPYEAGGEERLRWVANELSYQKNKDGREYVLEPGQGSISRRALRSAVASMGIDDEVRPMVRDALRARRRAKRRTADTRKDDQ